MKFSTLAKNFSGYVITHYAPTLVEYMASAALRQRFQINANAWSIDIREKTSIRVIRISRNHAVYLLDMMGSFDYYYNSTNSILTKRSGAAAMEVVDFSTPRFHQITGFVDFPIMCSSLTEPFVTTQQYMDFAQLKADEVAIDLGSYSCLTSISFSKAVGSKGKVVAIEPDPMNYRVCEVNVAQHRQSNLLSNIELWNVAVSDTESFLEFSSEGAMGSSAVNLVGTFRGEVIKVPCTTLSEIAAKSNLSRVDFIKMDIEGSEQSVIDSSREFFEKFRPRVIVEPHMVNGTLSDKAVMAALTSYGYECKYISQIGFDVPLITAVPKR